MLTTKSVSKEYAVKVITSIGEKLYLNEEAADFHFVFELSDNRFDRIPAHKLFLATASDVFRAMFNGTWIEKDETKIVDASPSAFKEFLRFIYLAKAKVTTENVYQVMNLGNMYDITECLSACQDFLLNTLTIETMCLGYAHVLLENEELMKFCETNIKRNTTEIFSSNSFLECDQKVLKNILQLDYLYCTGSNVIEACMSWLKSASQQEHLTREIVQEHLGDLLYDIPFGLMNLKEFAAFVHLYGGLFTNDEHTEIIQMIDSEDFQPKIFKRNHKITIGNRKWIEDTVITCDRYLGFNRAPYFIKNIETTTFSTNKAILLGAITADLYQIMVEIPTRIMIIETNISKTSDDGVIVYNGKADLNKRILLSHPILIKPEFLYEIRMEQIPPHCCTRLLLLKFAVEIEHGTIVKFHRSNEETSSVMRGLIRKLEFNRI